MFKKLKVITLTMLLLMLVFSGITLAKEIDRPARFDIDGRAGDDFIGQASVLYPFINTKDSVFYTDLRYRVGDDDPKEWNIGLGYRKKLKNSDNTLAGVYLFRDRRDEYDTDWDMWTLGGEILTDSFDIRMNAYISDDDSKLSSPAGSNPAVFINNNKNLRISSDSATYYKSMDGLDVEIGNRLRGRDDLLNNVGAYLRFFRFSHDDLETMTGHQLRINKLLGKRNGINYKIGISWQDDNVRDSDTEATFAVSIPFGGGSDSKETEEKERTMTKAEALETRMTEKPVRDLDIVVSETEEEREETAAYDSQTGKKVGKVHYFAADGNSDGTKDDPYDIEKLNEKTKKNDMIILTGDIKASDVSSADSVKLKEGQKIISPKTGVLAVSDSKGNMNIDYTPEGEQASIDGNNSNEALIKIDKENITISGLKFKNTKKAIEIDKKVKNYSYSENKFENVDSAVLDYAADESVVAKEDGLNYVLNEEKFGTIIVGNDIKLSSKVKINRDVTINGQDYIISPKDNASSEDFGENENAHLMTFYSPSTIKNITFDNNKITKGIHAYKTEGVSLKNVTIKNSTGAALTVNGSKVEAENLVTKGSNWGSVNVDRGGNVDTPTHFTLTGDSTDLSEDLQIWSELGDLDVVDAEGFEGYKKKVDDVEDPLAFWTDRPLEDLAVNKTTKFVFPEIQNAINDAETGHTILVTEGIYKTKDLNITKKELELKSTKGAANTIIDIEGSKKYGVGINADNVVFDGFTVKNWGSNNKSGPNRSGIIVKKDAAGAVVRNNIVEANPNQDKLANGIHIDYTKGTTLVENNVVKGVGYRQDGEKLEKWSGTGIGVWGSSNVTIKNNIIQGSEIGVGVNGHSDGYDTENVKVVDNTINATIAGTQVMALWGKIDISSIKFKDNTIGSEKEWLLEVNLKKNKDDFNNQLDKNFPYANDFIKNNTFNEATNGVDIWYDESQDDDSNYFNVYKK